MPPTKQHRLIPARSEVVGDKQLAPLTDKQWVFVENYLTCWNATQAAITAGYSRKSARQIGAQNLSKLNVAHAIKERMAEHHLTADEVLARLAEHARGSMENFLDPDSLSIDLRKAQQADKLKLIKKVKYTVTHGKDDFMSETVEFELYDAQAALVHIGKHLNLFTDKSINLNLTPEDLAKMNDDELAALAAGKALPPKAGGA